MISHPRKKTLLKYIDGDLLAAQQQQIVHHIERCARCREKVNALAELENLLTPKKHLPRDFKDRFISNLEEVKRINQPTCGEIEAINGAVLICRTGDDEGVEGFPGMALKKGDTVRLIGDSRALIELNDGSSVYLNKDTEITLPLARHNLAMMAGEMFAMMKPQREQFEISTPSAVLGVLGTDFDAQVTRNEETILKVLKGKVSFQNDSGKTVVKKNQQVEASKQTLPKPTRIMETRSITNWTRPIRPPKIKGGTMMKNLGLIILVLAIIGGGIFYFQKRHKSAAEHIVKLEKTEPLELNSPYMQQGLSWRIRSDSEKKEGDNWIDQSQTVTRTEVLQADAENGSRVLLTIEEVKMPAESDTYWKESAARMAGRQFEYQVSPDGKMHSISIHDGKPLEGLEIAFFGNALGGSNLSHLFVRSSAVPGDQWIVQLDEKFPGYPNSFIKSQDAVQFVGYENRDGVEVAVLQDQYKASIGGGLPMGETVFAQGKKRIELEQLDFEGSTEYIIDTDTGRVVSAEENYRGTGLKGTVTLVLAGQDNPIEETYEQKGGDVTRSRMTVEYLP